MAGPQVFENDCFDVCNGNAVIGTGGGCCYESDQDICGICYGVITDAEDTAHHGVAFSKPKIDLDQLRNWKSNKVVKKLTMGLSQMAMAQEISGGF